MKVWLITILVWRLLVLWLAHCSMTGWGGWCTIIRMKSCSIMGWSSSLRVPADKNCSKKCWASLADSSAAACSLWSSLSASLSCRNCTKIWKIKIIFDYPSFRLVRIYISLDYKVLCIDSSLHFIACYWICVWGEMVSCFTLATQILHSEGQTLVDVLP